MAKKTRQRATRRRNSRQTSVEKAMGRTMNMVLDMTALGATMDISRGMLASIPK